MGNALRCLIVSRRQDVNLLRQSWKKKSFLTVIKQLFCLNRKIEHQYCMLLKKNCFHTVMEDTFRFIFLFLDWLTGTRILTQKYRHNFNLMQQLRSSVVLSILSRMLLLDITCTFHFLLRYYQMYLKSQKIFDFTSVTIGNVSARFDNWSPPSSAKIWLCHRCELVLLYAQNAVYCIFHLPCCIRSRQPVSQYCQVKKKKFWFQVVNLKLVLHLKVSHFQYLISSSPP